MATTSFAYGQSFGQSDRFYDDRFLDCEHDDLMTADDYDARRAQRDGWETATWDGRW